MAGWFRRLDRADEAAKHDKSFVLSCVRHEGLALQLAPIELRSDLDVASAAVRQNGLALRFASKELRSNRDFVLEIVQHCGMALKYAALDLRRDRQVVLPAVRNHGLALEHAGKDLRGDFAIVAAAVDQCGEALQHARSALRDHRDVVLAAVMRSGCAIEFASPELRRDVEVCCAACRNDPMALNMIEEPDIQHKARLSILEGAHLRVLLAAEDRKQQLVEEQQARDVTSKALLQSQSKLREPKKDRNGKNQSGGPLQEQALAWAKKATMGGKLYRMIEGWKEDNIPKIVQKGTLDLGDPWMKKAQKRKPAHVAPALQASRAGQGNVKTKQRMVMSMVRKEIYTGPEPEIVRNHILDVVQKMTGSDDLDMDTPLMESGVDSLMAVDLRTQLQADFKIPMSSTIMFNYPTMGGLAAFLVDELTSQKVPGWGQVLIEEVMQEVAVTEPVTEQVNESVAVEAKEAPASEATVQAAYQGPDPEMVSGFVVELVQGMTGSTDIDMETPLMESGLDSLASVDMRTQLQKEFSLSLPSTVMFNYPTILGLSSYLVDQLEANQITWRGSRSA